jgi:hypothetical protein
MKVARRWCFLFFAFMICTAYGQAQKKPAPKKAPVQKPKAAPEKKTDDKLIVAPTNQEEKVRDIVTFLEYLLNTLGNESTPARDKDVIITESFLKIFRDAKVQVEDDLDEQRKVITNKDVIAYLKDVDFFFKDVKFEFKIDKIEESGSVTDVLFYKVSLTRDLNGTTSDGKTINNSKQRFIEVNYNPKDQDLKIVSIYTSQFDEKLMLTNWWQQLSAEWQQVFKQKINKQPGDSVTLADIKSITTLTELDLNRNSFIQNAEPLGLLSKLNVLKLSGLPIADLTPLRNMTELTELTISGTGVSDISVLKYAGKLKKLDLSNTPVQDVIVLQKLTALQSLNISATKVIDLSPIASLAELTSLNFSSTKVTDVSALSSLIKLTELSLSNTPVTDIGAMENLQNVITLHLDSTRITKLTALSKASSLKLLYMNHVAVGDLSPLQNLSALEKIYCDQTLIKQPQAEAFMAGNPRVLVMFDSKDLLNWWSGISEVWKAIISKAAGISLSPTKEELARISKIDSINVSGQNVSDLSPLQKLPKLRVLMARKTAVSDLSPIGFLKEITRLDIGETEVKDLGTLERLPKLKVVSADRSKVTNIEFSKLPSLEKLNADETSVNDMSASRFLEKNPKCLLIYKSVLLKEWWSTLPPNWKDIFASQEGMSANPSQEQLHRLVEQTKITGKDAAVSSLVSLSEFVRLRELNLSGTALIDIKPVESLRLLKILHITGSPLNTIEGINFFIDLEELDISNTPIVDIYPVWQLGSLKKLNCAGTQIKRIDALEKLESLEYFDCSNTNVNKLDALGYLKLKTLKCFNTRISNKTIENFKAAHPGCSVMYYR